MERRVPPIAIQGEAEAPSDRTLGAAAIEIDSLAGDIAGAIRTEEGAEGPHLVGPAHPSDRHISDAMAIHFSLG